MEWPCYDLLRSGSGTAWMAVHGEYLPDDAGSNGRRERRDVGWTKGGPPSSEFGVEVEISKMNLE